MSKFHNLVSLGFFCGPASELERIGLRRASYPFDWLISDFQAVMNLIETNFDGFLEYKNLYQHKKNPNYYFDIKNKIHFFHDFDSFESLKGQIEKVKIKYDRRILRFYQTIVEPTLFIRYIANQEELEYIEDNHEKIINTLKFFNKNNELILVGNEDLLSRVLNIYIVKSDDNDIVAREFLNKNKELKDYLLNNVLFSEDVLKENIKKFNEKEKNKKKKKVFISRIFFKAKTKMMKKYIHDKIV